MRKERLQNHISGSVLTLPVCAVVAVLLWWFSGTTGTAGPAGSTGSTGQTGLSGIAGQTGIAGTAGHTGLSGPFFDAPHYWGFALLVVITYVLVEMNNRNQLLRVRSRMVSSVWLVCVAAMGMLHNYSPGLVATATTVVAYFLLFRTYETHHDVVDTFHYGLMIGLGSLFVPHTIIFLPLFFWHQLVFLRSTSLRTFLASLVGCLFPLLLWAGYYIFLQDFSPLLAWWKTLSTYTLLAPENYLSFSVQQVAAWGLVSLLGLIGLLHYLSTNYNDKIQVRMFLYVLCLQWVVIQTFLCLQPQHYDELLPLLTMSSAPLIAHFFALTRSWFTNALFVLSVLAFIALGYLTMMMPTLRFIY